MNFVTQINGNNNTVNIKNTINGVEQKEDDNLFNQSTDPINNQNSEQESIQKEMVELQKEITRLMSQLAIADSADEQSNIQSQINDKQNELNNLQGSGSGTSQVPQNIGGSGSGTGNDLVNMLVQLLQTFLSALLGAMGGNASFNTTVNGNNNNVNVQNAYGNYGDYDNYDNYDSSNSGASTTSFNIDKDSFAQELDQSFASHSGSVLNGKGAQIYDIATRNGINPALFAAIICNETGYGTSAAIKNKNNPGGIMKSGGGLKSYGSVDEGLESMAKLLKKNYVDQGLTSISSIGAKYCPGSDNSSWVRVVTQLFNKFST